MKYALILTLAAVASGQKLDLSTLDKLASKAKESSIVTLGPDQLKVAGDFLSKDNEKEQKTKDLVSTLRGVYVRSFEFAKPGAFTQADLEPIRKQLSSPGWSKIIEHKEEGETAEIYYFKSSTEGGMAIINTETEEVTVVNIVGPVDFSTLGNLGNIMGVVPKMQMEGGKVTAPRPPSAPSAPPPPAAPKKDDDDGNQ